MAKDKLLQVFLSEGCGPCDALKSLVQDGLLELEGVPVGTPVEVHDISTDEGFPFVEALGLTEVPTVLYDGHRCQLNIKDQEDGGQRMSISCVDPSFEPGLSEDPASEPASPAV